MEAESELAYAIQEAYRRKGATRSDVVREVKTLYPHASVQEIMCMWEAIDAYVDMTT